MDDSPTGPADQQEPENGLEERIATALTDSERSAATAESLTGGAISAALSAIKGASAWFRGSVVAYSEEVKFDLLGVDRGPVINALTAEQMATGVARLIRADFTVATTGVGGPGPQEGVAEGTVFIAVRSPENCSVRSYRFEGGPEAVVRQTTDQALRDLASAIDDARLRSARR